MDRSENRSVGRWAFEDSTEADGSGTASLRDIPLARSLPPNRDPRRLSLALYKRRKELAGIFRTVLPLCSGH